jgi:hypothetical protein
MRRYCNIDSKKQHGLASEKTIAHHRQGPSNHLPGVLSMILNKVWETGWIQAGILMAAVVGAVAFAFTVRL